MNHHQCLVYNKQLGGWMGMTILAYEYPVCVLSLYKAWLALGGCSSRADCVTVPTLLLCLGGGWG